MSDPYQPQPDPAERRADAAHRCTDRSVLSRLGFDEPGPSLQRSAEGASKQTVERLETLDDLVFEAIAGKTGALEELRLLWPQTLGELGRDLLDESRDQYLRHAISVWRDCVAAEEISNPRLAIAAMDVICVLLEG